MTGPLSEFLEANELSDRELLMEIVENMREVRKVVDELQTQAGPMLAAAKSSPLLKMLGI